MPPAPVGAPTSGITAASTQATLALTLGVIGAVFTLLTLVFFLSGVVAIASGITALVLGYGDRKAHPPKGSKRSTVTAAIVLGYISVITPIVLIGLMIGLFAFVILAS